MTWLWYAVLCAVFAGGYVASIYSWPKVRELANGIEAEATELRNKAVDLENRLRGK